MRPHLSDDTLPGRCVRQRERNIRSIFEQARRRSPYMLFMDEIDAPGAKRSRLRSDATGGAAGRLLWETEDAPARLAVLRHHLKERPVGSVEIDIEMDLPACLRKRGRA